MLYDLLNLCCSYYCTVSHCHSITKAAEELYVTQPTVSVAIRDLEIEFGISLFYRKGNCKIWVYAQNGVYKVITVTVK